LTSPKPETVTGLLLLSPWRTDNAFDLFLPCSIDTLKTLKSNISIIQKDTAYRTLIGQFSFSKLGVKMRNESVADDFAEDTKYSILIPITAEYDRQLEKRMKNIEGTDITRMPYIFDQKTIIEFYSTKNVFLKNIRGLNLLKD
jgi:hypothetical protein